VSKNKEKVFLKKLSDWSEENIQKAFLDIFRALEPESFIKKDAFTGIKLSFGEEGTSGYIKSNWLKELIKELKQKTENLFIIETNTLYREKRSNAIGHLHVANMHGYNIENLGIPIIIADGLKGIDGQNIAIRGSHFENVKLARGICETDILISISHVTGHCEAGFAASLKNLGMGCASRAGKLQQHSKTLPEVTIEKCISCGDCMSVCPVNAIGLKKKKAILVKERCIGCGECTVVCSSDAIGIKYDENAVKFQEKMVEYALGVKGALNSKIACINLLYNITKNCDCMSKNEEPFVSNIGIIGGLDAVAVDKATLDIIGIDAFKKIFPEIDPMIQINHGEKIKLGSTQYELLEV